MQSPEGLENTPLKKLLGFRNIRKSYYIFKDVTSFLGLGSEFVWSDDGMIYYKSDDFY